MHVQDHFRFVTTTPNLTLIVLWFAQTKIEFKLIIEF